MAPGERETEADVAPAPPKLARFYSLLAKFPDGSEFLGGYGALPGVGPEDIIDEFAERGITVLWLIQVPLPELPPMPQHRNN